MLQQLEQLQKELNFLEEDIKRVEVKWRTQAAVSCRCSSSGRVELVGGRVARRGCEGSVCIFQEMSGLYSPMMEAECTVPNVEAPSPAPRCVLTRDVLIVLSKWHRPLNC